MRHLSLELSTVSSVLAHPVLSGHPTGSRAPQGGEHGRRKKDPRHRTESHRPWRRRSPGCHTHQAAASVGERRVEEDEPTRERVEENELARAERSDERVQEGKVGSAHEGGKPGRSPSRLPRMRRPRRCSTGASREQPHVQRIQQTPGRSTQQFHRRTRRRAGASGSWESSPSSPTEPPARHSCRPRRHRGSQQLREGTEETLGTPQIRAGGAGNV